MTSRFDRDFSVLLEEEKGLGDAAAQELHDFLSGVQDRLIELKQQGLAKELGLTA